ncbi:MAG: hypothetical protein P1U86_08005 [Verrucomicrobiales bacterium]|nr:hypothetical protein [Verrucomicrobiales bacterium]
MNLETWLEEQGLSKYDSLFAYHEISDLEVLALLSEAELESIGLPLGPRKKILSELSQLEPKEAGRATEQVAPPFIPSERLPHLTNSEAAPTPRTPAFSGSSRIKAKGKSSRKATAIFVAVAVHVAIILIATTLTIFAATKDEPEIIAMIAPPSSTPQQEMKKKTVQKQVRQAPSAASAAAAPMAQMMKANAEAQFSTPDVTRTSTGPLGIGDGDLGTGAFGAGTGLGDAGGGRTLFGSSGNGSLKGYLYDLKRDSDGKGRRIGGMEDVPQSYRDFMPHLHKLIKGDFSDTVLSDHMRVGNPLTFNFLTVPIQDAKVGPEAFGAKGEMKPSGWLAVYKGRIKSKGATEIRLVGRFDDVLLVFHNGKLVLDGTYIIPKAPTATNFRPSGEIQDRLFKGQGGQVGPWFRLSGGDELVIVVGEIPGGALGGGLFCQEKGVNYKEGKFAPFVIGNLSEEDRARLKAVQGCTLERIPSFF